MTGKDVSESDIYGFTIVGACSNNKFAHRDVRTRLLARPGRSRALLLTLVEMTLFTSHCSRADEQQSWTA